MTETPEQTRDRLYAVLAGRRSDIDRLYSYYRGDHPLPWAPREVQDAYRALMNMSRSNWCRLVVQAPAERLRAVGIRFGEEPADGLASDVDVWRRIWQGNRLDAQSRLVHNAGLVARRGFALVWPTNSGPAQITPEHPSQVIVDYEPGNQSVRRAALKCFVDGVTNIEYATLWTAEKVFSWQRNVAPPRTQSKLLVIPEQPPEARWKPWQDESLGIVPEAENPMGVVSMVEFQAHPELVGEPLSELDGGVTDVQDRINKTVLDRLVTANFAAFPQKWATGLEIPEDDEGKPIETFKTAVNRMFVNEDPNGKFGTFEVADLSGYLKAVEADIQHLAATTRTPPHYLLGQSGSFPSGDSLKATETGLVAKVLEIRDSYTESWEDVIRLALKAEDDPRSEDMALSVLWRDPESRSDAERTDAATKQAAVGVPWRSLMEYLGKTPEEIVRLDTERKADAAAGLYPVAAGGPLSPPQGPPERPVPGL